MQSHAHAEESRPSGSWLLQQMVCWPTRGADAGSWLKAALQTKKPTNTSATGDADRRHNKRGAELLGIDGRATQHPAGIATVAAFRPWRSSQTRSHQDPTIIISCSAPMELAERVGFEPTVSCPTHAFQACTFVHSVTSPQAQG